MKFLLPVILCCTTLFAACSGGGGGDNLGANPVILTEDNQTIRFDRPGEEYGVEVLSSGNRLTFAAGNHLSRVGVAGTNNQLTFEQNVVVGTIELSGANNSVSLSNTVTVANFQILGTNAQVTINAGDQIGQLFVLGSNATISILNYSANVPSIRLAGSNIVVRVPPGYLTKTTVTDTGANNSVAEF